MTKARSNAVANAAKGDLTVGNGTDLSGILAVGSNGDTLVADSSTSTGLRYTAGTVQSNPVLNSAMQIWQRGTASTSIPTSGNFFLADRWQAVRGGFAAGGSVSRQLTNDTTNLPFIQYCQRVQRDSGNTSTATLILGQNFESINSIPFAGKTVTLSFYARAGANYSPTASALAVRLVSGTGTDQNGLTGAYTGGANTIAQDAILTTTWQRFSYSATLPTTMTEMNIQIVAIPTGTAGAADFFEVTGVQIDVGSVALPFRTNGETIQGELAACQRYYCELGNALSGSSDNSTTTCQFVAPYPVQMRISPSVSIISGRSCVVRHQASDKTSASPALVSPNMKEDAMWTLVNGFTGLTANGVANSRNSSTTSRFIAASAEL